MHLYKNTLTYIHPHLHTQEHGYISTFILYTHIYIYAFTKKHTHIPTPTFTHTGTHMNTDTYIRIHTEHIYTHTYI